MLVNDNMDLIIIILHIRISLDRCGAGSVYQYVWEALVTMPSCHPAWISSVLTALQAPSDVLSYYTFYSLPRLPQPAAILPSFELPGSLPVP